MAAAEKSYLTPFGDNRKPPPAPNADDVSRDLSCQGTIGLTLQQVLDELPPNIAQLEESRSRNGSYEPLLLPPLTMCAASRDRILQSFGESVAESQRKPSGPPVVLRGRVEYYNRLSRKWRLVVKDAELLQRLPLDRYRRRRERPSFWQIAKEQQASNVAKGAVVSSPGEKFRLDLLLYNDIE